jgi:hypothetical protein
MHNVARGAAGPMTPTGLSPGADPTAGENLDSSLMEAISRGSHEAFAALFDRTAKTFAADLTARLPEPRLRIAILAATYVEVWWLAGCRSGAKADVPQWINHILARRISDLHRALAGQVHPEPGHSRAELELADLLGRPIGDLWPG